MTRIDAQPVPWAARCVMAESARWHSGHWWWIDAVAGAVFRCPPGAATPGPPWLSVGGRVSLVHPAAPAGMLVARRSTLQVYLPGGAEDRPTGVAPGSTHPDAHDSHDFSRPGPVLAELDLPPGWLLNDGAAGPENGLYIGIVDPERDPSAGYLQHVRPDGSLGCVVRGIALSNGVAVDPSGTVLYHADSARRLILEHRLDGRGDVAGSAVHLSLDPDDGMPDGLATDAAGGLWVAVYGAGQVRRYAPGGELDIVVRVPTAQVTSVALGGGDGRDLLITTAREGYDRQRSAAEPLAGRLFSARSPYPGRPLLPVRPG